MKRPHRRATLHKLVEGSRAAVGLWVTCSSPSSVIRPSVVTSDTVIIVCLFVCSLAFVCLFLLLVMPSYAYSSGDNCNGYSAPAMCVAPMSIPGIPAMAMTSTGMTTAGFTKEV